VTKLNILCTILQ